MTMPPVDTSSLLSSLASSLPKQRVLTGEQAEGYDVDGLRPAAVALPESVEEASAVLAAACEQRAAVVPWGSGTAMALGNLPRTYDLALVTRSLGQILEYEPADLTLTVQAGITMAALADELRRHGQFLPLDAPEKATLGGVLATGAFGPWRHAYGPARDWVLGVRVVHADGRVTKAGGRVVKNVAGYDMTKLYLGSLGTLGVIVEASLKVTPLPAAAETWAAACPSSGEAVRLALDADSRGLRLAALTVAGPLGPDGPLAATRLDSRGYAVLAQAVGTRAAVERSLRDLDALAVDHGLTGGGARLGGADEVWQAVRALARPTLADDVLLVRALLSPRRVSPWLERTAALAAKTGLAPALAAHAGTGCVFTRWQGSGLGGDRGRGLLAALSESAVTLGGAAVADGCAVELKHHVDVWGRARADFTLMRRLKEQFDPHGTLNPGRFLGRL
jgi:glycolate oxidase FAD binding subunit